MKTTTMVPFRKADEDKGYLQLQSAMNELLDNFWPATELPVITWSGNGRTWIPRMDVAETEKELIINVELPGMDEKDVKVSISGDQLLISGEKLAEKEERGKTFHRVERNWGSFQRVLPLFAEVDRNAIKALFKKGVLSVTLPKTAKAIESVRTIPVQAS